MTRITPNEAPQEISHPVKNSLYTLPNLSRPFTVLSFIFPRLYDCTSIRSRLASLARFFTLSDFNCPQAAKMSRPRGVLIGEA